MKAVIVQLNPKQKYIFETADDGVLPLQTPMELLSTAGNEDLDLVQASEVNCDVWHYSDGWNKDAFDNRVRDLVNLIDRDMSVSSDFLDKYRSSGYFPFPVVQACFANSGIKIGIDIHGFGDQGLLDCDISGIGNARRAVFYEDIKDGDKFNVYYGRSSKGGATWDTDLKTSISIFFLTLNK